MKSKKKNSKVPKSAKTRLSDLAAKKDARGGQQGPSGVAGRAPVAMPRRVMRRRGVD
jgi:hypothetical protein